MDPRDAAGGEEEDRVAGSGLSQVVQTVEAVEQVGGTEDDSSESGDRGREYLFIQVIVFCFLDQNSFFCVSTYAASL